MSPVERTAAWVLNNGQYEEVEEDAEQNPDEVKHAEKVDFILYAADLKDTRWVLSTPLPNSELLSGAALTESCFQTQIVVT